MSNIKKYIVIGDVHGRTNWQKLVEPFDEDTMYIFVGDFTDPYYGWEAVTHEQMFEQIDKIFALRREHPNNFIILAANHDYQYIVNEGETNRFSYHDREKLHKIFTDNSDLIDDVAYQIAEKYLITHAGVTKEWYEKWIGGVREDLTLQEICDQVNKLWREEKKAFSFRCNATRFSDCYGDSPTHSPIWVRPLTLWEHNIFGFGSGKIQVVGHTRFDPDVITGYQELEGCIMATGTEKTPAIEDPRVMEYGLDRFINDGMNICRPKYNDNETPDMIQIDCLATETACIEINPETLEWKKVKKIDESGTTTTNG